MIRQMMHLRRDVTITLHGGDIQRHHLRPAQHDDFVVAALPGQERHHPGTPATDEVQQPKVVLARTINL